MHVQGEKGMEREEEKPTQQMLTIFTIAQSSCACTRLSTLPTFVFDIFHHK